MRIVETDCWILALPDEWEADQEEDTVYISDEDNVGEIAITTLQKDGSEPITDVELEQFSEDIEASGQAINLGQLTGSYFEYADGEDAVREWHLFHESTLLIITYHCLSDDQGMDDAAVDAIIATLDIKSEDG